VPSANRRPRRKMRLAPTRVPSSKPGGLCAPVDRPPPADVLGDPEGAESRLLQVALRGVALDNYALGIAQISFASTVQPSPRSASIPPSARRSSRTTSPAGLAYVTDGGLAHLRHAKPSSKPIPRKTESLRCYTTHEL